MKEKEVNSPTRVIDISPNWIDLYTVLLRSMGMMSSSRKIFDSCKPLFLLADEIKDLQKRGVKHIDLSFDEFGRVQLTPND